MRDTISVPIFWGAIMLVIALSGIIIALLTERILY